MTTNVRQASTITTRQFGLDGTYATALFKSAIKKSTVESVALSLSKLSKQIETDRQLSVTLDNFKTLSLNDRLNIVNHLVKNDRSMDFTIKKFLNVLATNNSLNLIPKISTKFDNFV